MKKKETVRKVKARVWKVFSEYIRKRDCLRTTGSLEYGECITCSASLPRSDLHAGHFVPGRHNANLFSERGCHAQCFVCNVRLGGYQLEYRRQIVKLYGEGADLELEAEARVIRKFTIQELEELEQSLKERIKKLEQ